jgi:hypothetical protein
MVCSNNGHEVSIFHHLTDLKDTPRNVGSPDIWFVKRLTVRGSRTVGFYSSAYHLERD